MLKQIGSYRFNIDEISDTITKEDEEPSGSSKNKKKINKDE